VSCGNPDGNQPQLCVQLCIGLLHTLNRLEQPFNCFCLHLAAAAVPLVGKPAPDFKATAVFDQEFIDVSLSQYRGKYVVSSLSQLTKGVIPFYLSQLHFSTSSFCSLGQCTECCFVHLARLPQGT
jgi:hypothetical protein